MAKDKKLKKCSRSSRILWYAFSSISLGARSLAAIALLAIAVKLYPLKYQGKFFNTCVEEVRVSGKTVSEAVNFCNGGS